MEVYSGDFFKKVEDIVSASRDSPTSIACGLRRSALRTPAAKEGKWRGISVWLMIADGVSGFTEVGPGKVLQGLVKKVDRQMPTESAEL